MSLFKMLSFWSVYLSVTLVLCHLGAVGAVKNIAPVFPAVFGFGDSTIDTGNNNLLPTVAKCNFPPYGKDFIRHQPTGRFSNGRVLVDFLVSGFGIKDVLPAYLSPTLDREDLLTGVCFASGASGFDPLTNQLVPVISMNDQLELFKEYKQKLQIIVGDGRAGNIISQSLYVVCAGSNDVTNTYFGLPFRRIQYNFPAYAEFLVSSATTFVEELYNLGARKIAVVGLPPLGCLPSQRTIAGGVQRDCVTLYNQASEKYNHELSKGLHQLPNKLTSIKIVYADMYEILLDLIEHHSHYGFDESAKGCCGTGELETAILCNSLSSTCPDASKYVFWDSFHLSEKAYEIITHKIIQNDIPVLF